MSVFTPQAYKDLIKAATNKKGARFVGVFDVFAVPDFNKV